VEIIITPVLGGSGGIGRLFLGAALIGIGILTGGTGLILAGAAMALQGILGGSPDAPKPDENDAQSLVFSGQNTTTTEGNRLSVIAAHKYLVGCQIISFAIKSEYLAN
jgi:predicted phage tail protein